VGHVKYALNNRNKYIDRMTIDDDKNEVSNTEWLCGVQVHLAEVEIINVYQLFSQLRTAHNKITNIINTKYDGVIGPRPSFKLPPIFDEMMEKLRSITSEIVDGGLPPEPSVD
jgi:hypothetical protein